MGIETAIAFALLGTALISFVLEKVSMDITAITLFATIACISSIGFLEFWPSVTEVFSVFSNDAPLTIASMFILSTSLSKCHVLEQISNYLGKFCHLGYEKFMLVLLCLVALVSAFINNTPVVVVLLPVVISLSRKLDVSSSKMLIPVSYASICGGCCTLVGTSTNILASGIMESSDLFPEMQPMSMFELAKIGIPLMVFALAFLVMFGKRLLPDREALSSIISEIERKEFLTEAIVLSNSALIGKTIEESKIKTIKGTRLLDIVRGNLSVFERNETLKFRKGDKIILSCKPEGIIEAQGLEGLDIFNQPSLGIEHMSSKESVMVEAIVGPSSSLVSKTLQEANFRSRYNLSILAIHRKGKNLNKTINETKFRPSDTLLILGTEDSIEGLRNTEEVILLDQVPLPVKSMRNKSPIVLSVLFGIVTFVSFGILPISTASILGVAILFLTGCIKPNDAYRSIEWNIIILIYGMLTLGVTMQKSGASSMLASVVEKISIQAFTPEFQIIGVLIILYLVTAFLTEVLSNNATIVIMAPIALEIANYLGLGAENARAYVLTACIAASASFVTPIGYQTNTFVYTVGGYRFRDFFKVGIFLNLIYFTGTILLVGTYWNFF